MNVSAASEAALQQNHQIVLVLHDTKHGSVDETGCVCACVEFLGDGTSRQWPRFFLVLSPAVAEVEKSFLCFHLAMSGLWAAEAVGACWLWLG